MFVLHMCACMHTFVFYICEKLGLCVDTSSLQSLVYIRALSVLLLQFLFILHPVNDIFEEPWNFRTSA